MIVLDTSAIVAILREEPEADSFLRVIVDTPDTFLSAVNYQEAGHVMRARSGELGIKRLNDFLSLSATKVLPYTHDQAMRAIEAFGRYGKGMGHPAQLNLCDCAAYALAMTLNAPLLFKGNDFAQTDVQKTGALTPPPRPA